MIKLIKPYLAYSEVENSFKAIFDSGWFTKGSNVKEFKEKLAKYTGSKCAHLSTSATTALSLCLKVLDIKPGDEVVVSDFSFPATVNVVEDLYATPVFADVDPKTFNMRPEELEKKITKKTKAVIFVDALGNPSGIHEIKEVCSHHNIPLIEDAACAIGSSENGVKCGKISDLTCFSFHPRKLLCTGEGGAVLTDNEEWNELLKIKSDHGSVNIDGSFDFIDYGYNYRLSEIQACMGLVQLNKLDEIIIRRNKIRDALKSSLEKIGYKSQLVLDNVQYNVQSLVFIVPPSVSRDELIMHLRNNEIESTLGTYCLSGCTYYKNKYNNVQPVAQRLQDTTITLPCHDDVDPEQICEVLYSFGNK